MEKLLWEIPGVEYIYSTSQSNGSMSIVRFKVGEDYERSIVKLNQKLQANFDRIPPAPQCPLSSPARLTTFPSWPLRSTRQETTTPRSAAPPPSCRIR